MKPFSRYSKTTALICVPEHGRRDIHADYIFQQLILARSQTLVRFVHKSNKEVFVKSPKMSARIFSVLIVLAFTLGLFDQPVRVAFGLRHDPPVMRKTGRWF